ncbi:plasmid partitioning protein RepB C-terminal domain-containing protein [Variovorax sp. PvP013]|jgi:hypothetical protein|uniref:plasmid partitioning protein RepB C-terminal domain-containing protein n=1 Tax=Variovorax sp. PvP013 TaxID=3156435 RepID=UPI003D1CF433
MPVTLAFLMKPLSIAIDSILPSRLWRDNVIETKKVQKIRASIEEIDIIEPLSVCAVDRRTGRHLLLDGHLRLLVLRQLGRREAPCIIATDNESYTYNNRVNRMSTIQEHFMILRAIERGVSKERLARALCMDPSMLGKKVRLLDGLCEEATMLLKQHEFSPEVCSTLRKMKPARQVECAELMLAASMLTVTYAKALLVATPVEFLVSGKKPTPSRHVTHEQICRMEREMSNLQDQYRSAERSFGEDTLNLVLAQGYLRKLVENEPVRKYLDTHYTEVLKEFESIVATSSMQS